MLREIFLNRNLIRELCLKDLKVRYSRPLLGFFWAFLSPLFLVLIFYVVFSKILQVQTAEAPFVLYLMSGVFTWKFFQDALMGSVSSIVDNKNLVKESNFPHYLIPLSIVLAAGINNLACLTVFIAIAAIFLKGLPVFFLGFPLVLAIHLILAAGLSILFSLFYVRWRDAKYLLEILLTVLFYFTPAFYSVSLVREAFPAIGFNAYLANPLVGILNFYRIATLKGFYAAVQQDVHLWNLVIIPALSAAILLGLSLAGYRKFQKTLNDYLAY